MFDFHMHSRISFDSDADPLTMALTAKAVGMKEICFTDHLDYDPLTLNQALQFDTQEYNSAYDDLEVPGLQICKGMEFGMLPDNRQTLAQDLQRRHFDFVIGSVHFVEGIDIYYPEAWEGKTVDQAERRYLEEVLACVQHHDDFDVLGHLTYISKAQSNPLKRPVVYENYRELVDEIFCTLIAKDKGIEVNTGAVDINGLYQPEREFVLRFKELGGKFVTVGSDAHNDKRPGQYCMEAAKMVQDIFGYVCTYHDRTPVFHKI